MPTSPPKFEGATHSGAASLVQQLFFPSFTDAGSNETFVAASSSSQVSHDHHPPKNNNTHNFSHKQQNRNESSIRIAGLEEKQGPLSSRGKDQEEDDDNQKNKEDEDGMTWPDSCESVTSEATTAVLDNRSKEVWSPPPPPPPMDVHPSHPTAYAFKLHRPAHLMISTAYASSTDGPRHYHTKTARSPHHQHQTPPPFFASTRPHTAGYHGRSSSLGVGTANTSAPTNTFGLTSQSSAEPTEHPKNGPVPESPPKLARRLPPPTRSLSTVAVVDEADGDRPENKDGSGDDNQQDERPQRDHQPATEKDPPDHDQSDRKDDIKLESHDLKAMSSLETNGDAAPLTGSADSAAPDVAEPPTIEPHPTTANEFLGANASTEVLVAAVDDANSSSDNANHSDMGTMNGGSQYGRQLLLQKDQARAVAASLQDDGAGSEVLSTASEMGTVINMVQRMEDILAMDDAHSGPAAAKTLLPRHRKQSVSSSVGGDSIWAPSPTAETPSSAFITPQYSKPIWDETDLALPTLDSIPSRKLDSEREEEEKKHSEQDIKRQDASSSAILSRVMLRSIGSGLSATSRNSVSAPSTPRNHHHFYRSDRFRLSPRHRTQSEDDTMNTEALDEESMSSFLLRSPGSLARVHAHQQQSIASKRKSKGLTPRFSSWRFRQHSPGIARIPEGETMTSRVEKVGKATTAMLFARSCFSFDAYDTSMDDLYEFTVPNLNPVHPSETSQRTADVRSGMPYMAASSRNVQPLFGSSRSWDVAGTWNSTKEPHLAQQRQHQDLFRSRSRVPENHVSAFRSPSRPPRVRIASDFSTALKEELLEKLQSPQRIEIEREDALDILSCLVERGIAVKDEGGDIKNTDAKVDRVNKFQVTEDNPNSPDISSLVATLKQLVEANTSEVGQNQESFVKALDSLLRSHEYEQEMRRASQSASSWLKSIGRSQPDSSTKDKVSLDQVGDNAKGLDKGVPVDESGSMDLLTVRAMLHSAQIEAKDKAELASRLNDELAICRAEIGRLRSAAHASTFRSPNRSILDESDDASANEPEDNDCRTGFEATTSPIVEEGDDGSTLEEPYIVSEARHVARATPTDAERLQVALNDANQRIRELHARLKDVLGHDRELPLAAPVVEVAGFASNKESPGNKDERVVNVRMLDSENFVTDWDELIPPLPPPPDHGLRSPIVAAVLEQWSSDLSLHESLLSWMDQVMGGSDTESIPSLSLNSLDHQVRDGFVMHILPLLLRRPDIRVDVQTRARRWTTYDLNVTVEPSHVLGVASFRRNLEAVSSRSEIGVASTTHSTATALMANGNHALRTLAAAKSFQEELEGLGARVTYDEVSDEMGASIGQAPGIMSALGGALGGLLTRRRAGGVSEFVPGTPVTNSKDDRQGEINGIAPFVEEGNAEGESEEIDEQQPYHRVVSAPPGRIGVTFVEYRGHAMVSDVATDSPLVGWIFPSDILIAIDELPVSGMRIRDIIKVLKDRKGRQRALRVISSHAMNEFTSLNTSAIALDG